MNDTHKELRSASDEVRKASGIDEINRNKKEFLGPFEELKPSFSTVAKVRDELVLDIFGDSPVGKKYLDSPVMAIPLGDVPIGKEKEVLIVNVLSAINEQVAVLVQNTERSIQKMGESTLTISNDVRSVETRLENEGKERKLADIEQKNNTIKQNRKTNIYAFISTTIGLAALIVAFIALFK